MSDATQTVNLPENIDFNESDRKARSAFTQLAETEKGTIYHGVVEAVSITETKGGKCPGTLQFVFDVKALDQNGKPSGFSLRKYVQIPKANPNHPGHEVPPELARDYFKFCRESIRALEGMDTISPYPRKVEGTADQYFDPKTNERLDKKTYQARCAEVDGEVEAKIKEWFNKDANGNRGIENLKGAMMYFAVKIKDGRANIQYWRNDPGDATVVPAKFVPVTQQS